MGWSTGTALSSNGPIFADRPIGWNSYTSDRSVSASSVSFGAYALASRCGAFSGPYTGSRFSCTS